MNPSSGIDEWSIAKKWNPYNSDKLLTQVYRWRLIRRGEMIPQPSLVTVDPVYACNLKCEWCNSENVLRQRKGRITRNGFKELASGLAGWKGSDSWPGGVEAVCIAGGGEPLLNEDIGFFIDECVRQGIEVGVVTNGLHIDRFIPQLAKCTWVGVSVDAGLPETYKKLKGVDGHKKVCDNIRQLAGYAKTNNCRLGSETLGAGVSYKYLLYNGNSREVAAAAETARDIGCRSFHMRPAGIPWDKLKDKDRFVLDKTVKDHLFSELDSARKMENETFGVYGITHKFTSDLTIANYFRECYAVFMTAVFSPPSDSDGLFSVGLCCDRRGDSRLEFNEDFQRFSDFTDKWGSDEHWKMHDDINLADCPRCTYQPHNQIFEHVIRKDNMTYKFI